MYTEEKVKVVAVAWGTCEEIQFLAALAILHHDGLKNNSLAFFYMPYGKMVHDREMTNTNFDRACGGKD